MAIIIRDGTNAAYTAEVDINNDLHVAVDTAMYPNALRAALGTASVQSTTGSTTLIAAGAAGIYRDIISLVLTNEGTATVVSITDGTKTYEFALGANAVLPINFSSTLPAMSTATAWTISNSATQNVDCVAVYAENT